MKILENCTAKSHAINGFIIRHKWEIFSIIISFIIISFWTNLHFAILMYIVLVVHEGGHAWALIKKDIGVRRVYFFVIGGGVLPNKSYRNHNERTYVAIMGSIFTFIGILILSIAYYLTRFDFLANLIIFLSFLTIINLLPYWMLDGGKIKRCIDQSNRHGSLMLFVPYVAMIAFLMFKSNIALMLIIFALIDFPIQEKIESVERELNQTIENPASTTILTKKEVMRYYSHYLIMILCCIIISLILESLGYSIDASHNFDNVMNGL